jgi:hypothetical protein
MKNKITMNNKPQAEINTVLAAGAPETQTKHGHKGLGSALDSRGICVGATLVADDSIKSLMEQVHELDRRIKNYTEKIFIDYLLLASPPLRIEKFSEKILPKIKWRGIKLVRKDDLWLGGMHYTMWMEQRGKRLGKAVRVDYSDTGTCTISLLPTNDI